MAVSAPAPGKPKKKKRRKRRTHNASPLRRWTRPLRHACVVPALEVMRWLCGVLPQPLLVFKARLLAALAMVFAFKSRARAERQLLSAGVAAHAAEARKMTREMFFHTIFNGFEWMRSTHWDAAEIKRRIDFIGLENLERLQTQGHIVVGGHLGNWELIPRAYLAHGGRPGAIVMTPQRNAALNAWIVRTREMGGTKFFMDQAGMLGLFKLIRRGAPVALLIDQDSNRWPGLFVDFFGRRAYTPEGPARLAVRFNVPMVLLTIERHADDPWRHTVTMSEPIMPDPTADTEAEIARLTQAYTTRFEAIIRRTPAQWVWMHERWRHQPGQKIRRRRE